MEFRIKGTRKQKDRIKVSRSRGGGGKEGTKEKVNDKKKKKTKTSYNDKLQRGLSTSAHCLEFPKKCLQSKREKKKALDREMKQKQLTILG